MRLLGRASPVTRVATGGAVYGGPRTDERGVFERPTSRCVGIIGKRVGWPRLDACSIMRRMTNSDVGRMRIVLSANRVLFSERINNSHLLRPDIRQRHMTYCRTGPTAGSSEGGPPAPENLRSRTSGAAELLDRSSVRRGAKRRFRNTTGLPRMLG